MPKKLNIPSTKGYIYNGLYKSVPTKSLRIVFPYMEYMGDVFPLFVGKQTFVEYRIDEQCFVISQKNRHRYSYVLSRTGAEHTRASYHGTPLIEDVVSSLFYAYRGEIITFELLSTSYVNNNLYIKVKFDIDQIEDGYLSDDSELRDCNCKPSITQEDLLIYKELYCEQNKSATPILDDFFRQLEFSENYQKRVKTPNDDRHIENFLSQSNFPPIIRLTDLYDLYSDYCDNNSLIRYTKRELCSCLLKLGYRKKKSTHNQVYIYFK